MRRSALAAATALLASILTGCADRSGPLDPPGLVPRAPLASRGGAPAADDRVRRIEILDACDPTSFNAAIGAGTCVRPGGLPFDRFIAELTKSGAVSAWRFAPPNVEARVGETLLAINRGGEVHTFTEVEHFGGGIVPVLNQLSHNPVPAPECLALEPDDFVPPGGTYPDKVGEAGTELYQCCIHPWMRAVVRARGS